MERTLFYICGVVLLLLRTTLGTYIPPSGYPWQRPNTCIASPEGGDSIWDKVTPGPESRKQEYETIATIADHIAANLTIMMDAYNAGGLVPSRTIEHEFPKYGYPALVGFPENLEENQNAEDIILEGYRVVQDVAPFIELVHLEHALASDLDWAKLIEKSLKRGIVNLATELCISVISHSLTHPDDVGMDDALVYSDNRNEQRYERDYLIFRDAKVVMDYINNEFRTLI